MEQEFADFLLLILLLCKYVIFDLQFVDINISSINEVYFVVKVKSDKKKRVKAK